VNTTLSILKMLLIGFICNLHKLWNCESKISVQKKVIQLIIITIVASLVLVITLKYCCLNFVYPINSINLNFNKKKKKYKIISKL